MSTFLTTLPKDLLTQICEYLSLKELTLLNTTAKFFQPVVNYILIKKLKSKQVKQIATGWYHTLFLQQDGSVWACGRNDRGHLGIGNDNHQNSPIQVPLEDVQQIIAGGNHTFFLKTDGSIWACGTNSPGQLGIGNYDHQNNPVKVLLENVKQVIAAGDQTFFLKTDSTVWVCGDNQYGQLGIGNNEHQNKPQPLPKYQKLQAIIQKLQEKQIQLQQLQEKDNQTSNEKVFMPKHGI